MAILHSGDRRLFESIFVFRASFRFKLKFKRGEMKADIVSAIILDIQYAAIFYIHIVISHLGVCVYWIEREKMIFLVFQLDISHFIDLNSVN